MNLYRKKFDNLGPIEYKLASSRAEYEQALNLVYREYLSRGYILSKYYKSELRLLQQNALPETVVFIAVQNKEVVATVTLIPDSPLGLPMDQKYKKEADNLRTKGRRICEVGQLAIKSEVFGHKFFSMFNFNKLSFMFSLFQLVFRYARFEKKLDDLCIVTDPKMLLFKFLPFEEIGDVKHYGYDRITIKRKPAVAKRLDLTTAHEHGRKRIGLKKMFLDEEIAPELFQHRFVPNAEDFYYFFFQKSGLFKKMSPEQKAYAMERYNLDADDIEMMLKHRWDPSQKSA